MLSKAFSQLPNTPSKLIVHHELTHDTVFRTQHKVSVKARIEKEPIALTGAARASDCLTQVAVKQRRSSPKVRIYTLVAYKKANIHKLRYISSM